VPQIWHPVILQPCIIRIYQQLNQVATSCLHLVPSPVVNRPCFTLTFLPQNLVDAHLVSPVLDGAQIQQQLSLVDFLLPCKVCYQAKNQPCFIQNCPQPRQVDPLPVHPAQVQVTHQQVNPLWHILICPQLNLVGCQLWLPPAALHPPQKLYTHQLLRVPLLAINLHWFILVSLWLCRV